MANFNTFQARHMYVASALKTAALGDTSAIGDIYMASDKSGNFYFFYKNGDGKIVRSDTIPSDKIKGFAKNTAASLATPLKQLLVKVDTGAVTLSDLKGKAVTLTINVRGIVGDDPAERISFVATVVGDSTNTASATAFHKALAEAVAKALPKRDIPVLRVFSNGTEVAHGGTATGAAVGIVITQTAQKFILGQMSNNAPDFDVEFHYHVDNNTDVQWGTATALNSGDTGFISAQASIPGYFKVAELEHFCMGERGDVFRGYRFPNDYRPTLVTKTDGTMSYDMLTIDYYWSGEGNAVQQSPRTIHIAGPTTVINSLYTKVDEIVNPKAETAASGS